MTLTGTETKFYIGRKNLDKDVDQLLRYNNFNGMFSTVDNFDQTESMSKEQVMQLVQLHNQIAVIMNQPYKYQAIQRNHESFFLDENGEVIKDIDEIPVEDGTAEPTE